MVFFSVTTDTFLTAGNLLNVVRQAAPILIVSVAMTFVIITGGIDLSVGSMVALINAVGAILLAAGYPWPLVIIAMLVLGGGLGLVQGWFIAYQGIPAFIVTLAGLSILRGVALYITQGYSIPIPEAPGFFYLGRGDLLGMPVPALIGILVTIIAYIVLSSTRYGRRVVAVGSNLEAARRVGMPAKWILASVYLAAGMASAIAGLMIAARLGSGSSNAAVGFELQVVAAVVLGGTSLMGARHHPRHGAWNHDHRRYRQRSYSHAHLAVFHPDRDGRHHPCRHLAQYAHLHRELPPRREEKGMMR